MGGGPLRLRLFQFCRQGSEGEPHRGGQLHRSASPQSLTHRLEVAQADADATESKLPGGITEGVKFLLLEQWVEQGLMDQRGKVRQVLPPR